MKILKKAIRNFNKTIDHKNVFMKNVIEMYKKNSFKLTDCSNCEYLRKVDPTLTFESISCLYGNMILHTYNGKFSSNYCTCYCKNNCGKKTKVSQEDFEQLMNCHYALEDMLKEIKSKL